MDKVGEEIEMVIWSDFLSQILSVVFDRLEKFNLQKKSTLNLKIDNFQVKKITIILYHFFMYDSEKMHEK
jgi:hypothetical protein